MTAHVRQLQRGFPDRAMATLADLEQARDELVAILMPLITACGPFRIAVSLEGPDRPSAMILMFENESARKCAMPNLPQHFRPSGLNVVFDVVAAPAPPDPLKPAEPPEAPSAPGP